MDFNAPMEEQARTLLRKMAEVRHWATNGDSRAKPYIDAGAIWLAGGEVEFHRDQFLSVYTDELVAERMAPVDRMIEATKRTLSQGGVIGHGH
jgi:hypothetical protein